MAKSGIGESYVWQAVDNLMCQRADRREHDFAISINSDDEPTSFTLVGSELDRVWKTSA